MNYEEMSSTAEAAMATSVCSSVADDSGVHCDMGQSITEAEDLICDSTSDLLEKSTSSNLPDVVLESEKPKCDSNGNMELETTTVDEIVHRRRCKQTQGKGSQKKRVSFHEDILNSGRIDDVHIERGFVSYRGALADRFAPVVRNSWSASDEIHLGPRHVMSDLLTYGATDANTLFSPSDSHGSNQNSESDNSNDSTPLADTPFKSFSCDYSEENSPEMMKKQYFSEGDVNKYREPSPKRKIKSVLKKKHYVTTNVVEEVGKKQGKMQVLESLKSFYYSFKLGLSPTTSGVLEEPAAVEAAPLDAENEQAEITDGFVQVQLDEPIKKYRQPNRSLLSLNVSSRKSPENGLSVGPATERNLVLNGESTVYEHTGTSYCYVNDSFKTTFDTAREKFTPIPEESKSMCDSMTSSFRDERKETSQDIVDNHKNSKEKAMNPKESTQEKEMLPNKSENKLIVKENNNLRHLASPRKQIAPKKNIDFSCSDLASESERNSDFDLDDINLAKQSLLNKFMRNLQKGKNIDKQLKANKLYQNKIETWRVPLLYNGGQVDEASMASSHKLDRLINKEVLENRRISVRVMTSSQPSYYDSFEDDVALECCERLKLELSTNPGEHLLRLVRGRISETDDCLGSWVAVAALVTSHGIRFAARDVTRYIQLAVMTYDHIKDIQLGPDGQYVVVTSVSSGGVKLVTGDASLTDRFINSLMWAAAVVNLYPQWSHVSLGWDCLYYGEVCVAEENARDDSCLPSIDGYLMYKPNSNHKWTPAFFTLSNGVLRWEGRALPLERLEGARRVVSTRPHCFELALEKSLKHSLVLAAADDQEASDWLQALLQNAAFALDPATTATPRACTAANVRVTRDAVCLSRENGDLLTYGPHLALHAVRLPCDSGDWCQLEWSVCEANSGGETTLLFSCGPELDRFLETLDCVYKEAFDACVSLPLSVCACGDDGKEPVSCSCVGAFASAALKSAMEDLLPAYIQ